MPRKTPDQPKPAIIPMEAKLAVIVLNDSLVFCSCFSISVASVRIDESICSVSLIKDSLLPSILKFKFAIILLIFKLLFTNHPPYQVSVRRIIRIDHFPISPTQFLAFIVT